MMINPSIEDLETKDPNRYSLVVAVAKRAREITDDAENAGVPLTENPVSTAINDIYNDRVKIIAPPEAE